MGEISGRRRRPGGPGRHTVQSGEVELLRDADRSAGWLLSVDGVPQSYVDLDDPSYLEFDYVRWIAAALDPSDEQPGAGPAGTVGARGAVGAAGASVSVRRPARIGGPASGPFFVHVGGAGLTLPRYLATTRPLARQVVFEPDAALTALVRERLPLPRDSGIRVRAQDGRAGLAELPTACADVVALDAFSGGQVPASLVTVEFLRDVARVLRARGRYVANITDGPPLGFIRRVVATTVDTLANVLLVAEPAVLRGRRFGNLVVVASAAPLPVARLTRRLAGAAFRARVVADEDLRRFAAGATPLCDADTRPSPRAPEGTWGIG